ncbi:response regulator [Candidatus Sumerlaeota bacterium]|nr:response regulator [Candidatus Sumerlaeota bacterium]
MPAPKRILAVDDESDVLLVIKAGLENEGFQVQTASNGADALELARDELPDLIVLDVMMPKMNGFEVLRELKNSEETALIPVVMLTGLSDSQKIRQAILSGTDYYVVKPFDFDDLVMKIRTALRDSGFDAASPLA